MTAILQTVMLLVVVMIVIAVLAQRLKLAPSILLVIAGIGLAFIPGLPPVEMAPEAVLLVILPPLIYSAGVSMSWREFKFNLRPIFLLAFGCVIFTTCAVAAAVHYLLSWQWGAAFIVGAIVAPPDVVAPLAIARRLNLPHRLVVVLEGEGLANDATALILYRFAVAAVATGAFSLPQAVGTFSAIVVGEIIWGIGVGWLSLRLRQWAQNPRVEITLSLMTPYFAYWIPEHVGGSGVLATVACGLYVSWNGPLLISSATRLQGIFFWDLVIYLIEGFVFLLTGLQARTLIEKAQSFSIRDVLIATAITTAIVIVARFVWMFPAVYLPRQLSARLRKRDPAPPWQWTFVLAFTGVRGVVSLAAALAIPFAVAGGAPFPQRDLILFVTFGVIIATLVGQGLMLPSVIRWLGVANEGRAEQKRQHEAELDARGEAIKHAWEYLEEIAKERKLDKHTIEYLKLRHDHRMKQLPKDMGKGLETIKLNNNVRMELIAAEREFLYRMLQDGKITDESRRRLERELDLEEATILSKRESEIPL